MKQFRCEHSFLFGMFSFIAAAFANLSLAHAQSIDSVTCGDGVSLSATYANVAVNGGSCSLSGATVQGAVTVNGGSLVADNGTAISGGIAVKDGGTVRIGRAQAGPLTMENSGNLTLGRGANLASVLLKNSGSVTVRDGATVNGGIQLQESGGLLLDGARLVQGAVSVEKGNGDITVVNSELQNSDLIVLEQSGSVSVDGATLSDVKVQNIDGSVILNSVVLDSDTTIANISGNIVLASSVVDIDVTLGGDVELKGASDITVRSVISNSDIIISESDAVTLEGSDFGLEDVRIPKNNGPIVVRDNINLSLVISETEIGPVTLVGNQVTDLEVSKNRAGVSLRNNTGESLTCADNVPRAEDGGGNRFQFTKGECAGF